MVSFSNVASILSRVNCFILSGGKCIAVTAAIIYFPNVAAEKISYKLNYNMGVATHFVRKQKSMSHWDPEKYIPLIASSHIGWIRDEVLWRKLETSKGKYKIPKQDLEWINLAHSYGIKIIITLNGSNPDVYGSGDFYPAAYADAASYLAKELQGKIDAIEVVNEPFNWYANVYAEGTRHGENINGVSRTGVVGSWMKSYIQLLNLTAEKVKKNSSGIDVIGLGSFPGMNWRMLSYGISNKVDAITLHPYSYDTTPEILPYANNTITLNGHKINNISDSHGTFTSVLKNMLSFSRKNNGPSDIWLTEWGWTTKENGIFDRGHFKGVSEDAQAAYIQRRFLQSLGLNIPVSILYSFMDDKNSTGNSSRSNSEDNFGVLYSDGQPKKAYAALKNVAELTLGFVRNNDIKYSIIKESSRLDDSPAKSFDKTKIYAPDGIMSYSFRSASGDHIIAAWSMEKYSKLPPREAVLKFETQVSQIIVQDLLTKKIDKYAVSKNGDSWLSKSIKIPVNPVLIYVVENQ